MIFWIHEVHNETVETRGCPDISRVTIKVTKTVYTAVILLFRGVTDQEVVDLVDVRWSKSLIARSRGTVG